VPRILIIDDDEPIRKVLCEILTRAGYEVIQAKCGREGIQQYSRAPVDLVITDIVMPDGEGLETIRKLRSSHPDLKIFAMSGAALTIQLDILRLAETFGAVQTFEKPFHLNEILNAVRKEVPLPVEQPII
jgi:DNA-binding NtrC family response regulator